MISLGADDLLLNRYQPLLEGDLKVSTAAAAPNSRGHHDERLAWFWSMDVPQDTEANDWMSECGSCANIEYLADSAPHSLSGALASRKGQ